MEPDLNPVLQDSLPLLVDDDILTSNPGGYCSDFLIDPAPTGDYNLDSECTGVATCELCAKIVREAYHCSAVPLTCMTRNLAFRITSYDGDTPADYIGVSTGPLRYELRELHRAIVSCEGREEKLIHYYQKHDFMKARIVVFFHHKDYKLLLRSAIFAKKTRETARIGLNSFVPCNRILKEADFPRSPTGKLPPPPSHLFTSQGITPNPRQQLVLAKTFERPQIADSFKEYLEKRPPLKLSRHKTCPSFLRIKKYPVMPLTARPSSRNTTKSYPLKFKRKDTTPSTIRAASAGNPTIRGVLPKIGASSKKQTSESGINQQSSLPKKTQQRRVFSAQAPTKTFSDVSQTTMSRKLTLPKSAGPPQEKRAISTSQSTLTKTTTSIREIKSASPPTTIAKPSPTTNQSPTTTTPATAITNKLKTINI